jgi:hypothetical protein
LILTVLQGIHFHILIISFALQLTTLLFFFFAKKIYSGNKPGVKLIYRILAITTNILGTTYFCSEETGFCAKTPLYYYFLDDTANDHKQQRDHIYSKVAVLFLVLVFSMQVIIEWKRRQLREIDKLANITAKLARHRLTLANSMMKLLQTTGCARDPDLHRQKY